MRYIGSNNYLQEINHSKNMLEINIRFEKATKDHSKPYEFFENYLR